MKILALLLTVFVAALLGGCAKPAKPNAVSATTPAGASGGDAVKNGPDPNAGQGAAYRIVPPDPNDPKFKPDPKLAGGN